MVVLYEYTNKEQDLIKNAFRIGTFNSIRDLPNEIAPFAVTHNLKVKVQDTNLNSQITSHNSKIYREILKQNGGVFQKFGWMPDQFGIEHDIRLKEKIEDQLRAEIINPHVFQRAMLKKCLKYDYPFLGLDEVNTKSFLTAEDPYSISQNDSLRAHWIEEAKMLFG